MPDVVEESTLARLVEAFDWGATPLGSPGAWSAGLRTVVRLVLSNRFPMLLWWGPDYIQIYNDAYMPILGAKHPRQALGRPLRECWHEVFDVLRPLVDTPFLGGPATWMDDIELIVRRHGFAEESHFTIAYSPVPDEAASGGIGGVLATVIEISAKVFGERRLRILGELGTCAAEAKTEEQACRQAAEILSRHPKDIPFARLYLLDEAGRCLRQVAASGIADTPGEDDGVDIEAPAGAFAHLLADALRSGSLQMHEGLAALLPLGSSVPPGPWPEPPDRLAVVPIKSNMANRPAGALVAGISAFIRPDALYTSFLELVGSQIATAVANARAYEEERRRAEALARIDRAKTLFFSNISHEFRTPLMLMLGPLDDVLVSPDTPAGMRQALELAKRNAQRLLKLVNSLLDFARIEAGRAEARFAPMDLPALTTDLASTFRSAMERAGLRYEVACAPLDEPVYIDRAMWEKVVLNLLSNAFKFTLEGEVRVNLRRDGDEAAFEVADTGAGIPEQELPRLFERFHRVEGVPSRTHEGSGIGLALVQEIVRLHGGSIHATSKLGRGTRFIVRLPLGTRHIPPRQLEAAPQSKPASPGAHAYVEEALRWLPDPAADGGEPAAPATDKQDERFASTYGSRILLADDNADMRHYLLDLLQPAYAVSSVGDGEAALTSARERRPDLILCDVMMPRLDGFGLLATLRADPELKDVPVILVSARAGEESRIEGLAAGADDYLVKPFSARELLARVGALLELTRERRNTHEALRRQRQTLEEADRQKNEFLAMLAHELRNPLAPIRSAMELLSLTASSQPQSRRALDIASRQIAHMTRLIDDLLDVSRITQGRIELRPSPQRIERLLAEAVESIDPLVREKGHTVIVVRSQQIAVEVDPHRIVQCLGNVLGNAAKYTPPRGEIRIETAVAEGQAVVTISDNGVGIAPETLPKVFDLFAQGERTLDRSQGGLGIGLAIVRRLVEMHGGSVSASSAGINQGASFEIRLPLADAGPSAAAPARAKRAASRRILVVDDNRDGADVLAELLRQFGHEVQTAYTGQEALERLGQFRPDVALLDIGLPGFDGYELARRIRAQHPGPIRLVAVTGYGQDHDREQMREAGFAAHLLKPVEFDSLQRLLAEPLDAGSTDLSRGNT